jgi:hypothetical protein
VHEVGIRITPHAEDVIRFLDEESVSSVRRYAILDPVKLGIMPESSRFRLLSQYASRKEHLGHCSVGAALSIVKRLVCEVTLGNPIVIPLKVLTGHNTTAFVLRRTSSGCVLSQFTLWRQLRPRSRMTPYQSAFRKFVFCREVERATPYLSNAG